MMDSYEVDTDVSYVIKNLDPKFGEAMPFFWFENEVI